jgi:hypothetical protein
MLKISRGQRTRVDILAFGLCGSNESSYHKISGTSKWTDPIKCRSVSQHLYGSSFGNNKTYETCEPNVLNFYYSEDFVRKKYYFKTGQDQSNVNRET